MYCIYFHFNKSHNPSEFSVVADAKLFVKNSTDSKPSIKEKISGGTGISIQQVPYQVYLVGRYSCGGSIISPKHILTAAHCVVEDVHSPSYIDVRSGSSYTLNGGALTGVSNVIVHEEYTGAPHHHFDIAILVLSSPLKFNTNTQNISLLTRTLKRGEEAYISGWGAVDYTNSPTWYLQGATVQVVDEMTCRGHYGPRVGVFCAISSRGYEKNTCQGDSGGPIRVDGKLAGITSMGSPPCNSGKYVPGLFTSVYYHKDWIERKMKVDPGAESQDNNYQNPKTPRPVGNEAIINDLTAKIVDLVKYYLRGLTGMRKV